MNNNKPKPTTAQKKSTPPTKLLTPAKKARGAKRRPALDPRIKKAARAKNPPTRAMLEGFIKEALSDGKVWIDRRLIVLVLRACLRNNLEAPEEEHIRDLLALMFQHGKLVRVGSDRYKLPEEEAPPTTPSGRGEVITAGCTTEGEDQAVQEDRAWAGKVQKIILDVLLSRKEPMHSISLFHELMQACKAAQVDRPGSRRFAQIVEDMIDSQEVVDVGGRVDLATGQRVLKPGPNAKAEPAPPLGSKMPNRLRRTMDRERYAMRKAVEESLAKEIPQEPLTTDQVLAALTPVSDALGDLLAFPNEWPQEATLSLDFVLPSGLETFFDGIFGEKTIYTLKLTLIRPLIVGRIVEDVLIACQSDSPLGCAHHFLAHVERFVHYGAHNAPGKRPKHLTDALVELKAEVLGACAEASKVLQGAVLDNALRFFR